MKKLKIISIFIIAFLPFIFFSGCANTGDSFNIVISSTLENGIITISDNEFSKGKEVIVVVTPDVGYQVKEGTLKANGVAIQNSKFTMPGENVEITCEFELCVYTINIKEGILHGIITPSLISATYGTRIDLSISAEPGYALVSNSMVLNNETVLNNTASFSMPASNVVISARFEEAIYNVSKDTRVRNGNFTINYMTNLTNAAYEDLVFVSVNPAVGYRVKPNTLKYIDNQDREFLFKSSFLMPDSDVKIFAEFEEIDYALLVLDIRNGVVQSTSDTYNLNETVTLQIASNSGYKLLNLTVKNSTTLENISYQINSEKTIATFKMPASSVYINATFTIKAYAVTYTNTATWYPIYTTPLSNNEANYGSTIIFSVAGPSYWRVVDNSVEVKYVDDENTTHSVVVNYSDGLYSFVMPYYPVNITAETEANNFVVSYPSIGNHGTITARVLNSVPIYNNGIVDYGETIEITFIPDSGYYINNISYISDSVVNLENSNSSYSDLNWGDEWEVLSDKSLKYTFVIINDFTINSFAVSLINYTINFTTYNEAYQTFGNYGTYEVVFTHPGIAGIDSIYIPTIMQTNIEYNLTLDNITAFEGFEFSSIVITKISDGSTQNITNQSHSFSMPASDLNIEIRFTRELVQIRLQEVNCVLNIISGYQSYDAVSGYYYAYYGELITITAADYEVVGYYAPGFIIINIIDNGDGTFTEGEVVYASTMENDLRTFNFVVQKADNKNYCVINAYGLVITYFVVFEPYSNGTCEIIGGNNFVVPDLTIKFQITPDVNYKIKSIKIGQYSMDYEDFIELSLLPDVDGYYYYTIEKPIANSSGIKIKVEFELDNW